MQNDIKKKFQAEVDKYLQSSDDFLPYYPGMNVLSSSLYREQLEEVLELVKKETNSDGRSFGLYLETIIINMHTKVKKYKKSIYFDDENIKDIQNQGFAIPFYIDEAKGLYILLGIVPVLAT